MIRIGFIASKGRTSPDVVGVWRIEEVHSVRGQLAQRFAVEYRCEVHAQPQGFLDLQRTARDLRP